MATDNDTTRPKVVAIKTYVWTCASCGFWMGRVPIYAGTGDKGDCCERCGNTSINFREGRPFGPRSQQWEWLSQEVDEFFELFEPDSYELKDLLESLVLEAAR